MISIKLLHNVNQRQKAKHTTKINKAYTSCTKMPLSFSLSLCKYTHIHSTCIYTQNMCIDILYNYVICISNHNPQFHVSFYPKPTNHAPLANSRPPFNFHPKKTNMSLLPWPHAKSLGDVNVPVG